MSTSPPPNPPRPRAKFRFKSHSKRSPSPSSTSHTSTHRSKRHKTSHSTPHPHSTPRPHRAHHSHHPRRYPSPTPPSPSTDFPTTPPLSPNTAFREALFDALGDDEGAEYWQSVYGQPLHTYSRYYVPTTNKHKHKYKNKNKNKKGGGSRGEELSEDALDDGEREEVDANGEPVLERMDDEEYAAYVRRRMWERSVEGLEEERKKRKLEEERKRVREREREMREEGEWERGRDWELREKKRRRRVERERDERKVEREEGWKRAWVRYTRGWEELRRLRSTMAAEGKEGERAGQKGATTTTTAATAAAAAAAEEDQQEGEEGDGYKAKMQQKPSFSIPWPVRSGRASDVTRDAVNEFFRIGPAAASGSAARGREELLAFFKTERVRWHPDKMMQLYGALGIGERDLRSVTAVFQIVDRLWTELRDKGKDGR